MPCVLTVPPVPCETYNMQEIASEEVRRNFRRVVDDAEDEEHFIITKYGQGVAALVPVVWWQGVMHQLEGMHMALQADAPLEKWRELAQHAEVLLALVPGEGEFVPSRELRGVKAGIVPLSPAAEDEGT